MDKFEKGEIVIIQSIERPEFNGQETEIISSRIDVFGEKGYECTIRAPENNTRNGRWSESALRKKKPPKEETSWEKVHEIIGWSPTKDAESVV